MKTFEELGLSKNLLEAIKRERITEPTEIQELAIPHVIAGKDLVGESSTGSGKTLVFGCCVAESIEHSKGLQALILTPTRELAEQVRGAVAKFANLKVISIYGGVSMNPQIEGAKTADVVVATPGRLLDLLNQRAINLSKIKLLVLDEADRMLDMGFIYDVEKIIRNIPVQRQTLFFSATISDEIKRLANRYMKAPVVVSAKKYVDPSKLKQFYYDVPKSSKLALLVHLLKDEKSELVMIFCNTRRNVDFVVKNLKGNGISAIAIHGGLSQNKRTNVMGTFNKGKVDALVCTDVASRGLHIDNVSHIYNYDIPKDSKDYIHRIGRTARAGEEGKVINVLCEVDHENFRRIGQDYNNLTITYIELPQLERVTMFVPERRNFDNRRNNFHRGGFNRGDRHGSGRFGRR